MKESGIVRNVDNVGRVVIPKEIRKLLGMNVCNRCRKDLQI